jgi:hypothetical protein
LFLVEQGGCHPESVLTGSGRVFYDAPWEVAAMIWETPSFVEVKMDAEINSYQDDFDREDNGI